jgi:DNA-binding response OmpR family regulator
LIQVEHFAASGVYADESANEQKNSMELNEKAAAPIRVLVVEDKFLIGEWVAQALAEQGFAVQAVSNAADAVGCLAAEAVDILFTDINLPGGMDGTALARRARELRPNLAVVYASARAAALAPDARVPGAVILPKPYHPALVGRLLTALSRTTAAGAPA